MNSHGLLQKLKSFDDQKEEKEQIEVELKAETLNELWVAGENGTAEYKKKEAEFIATIQKFPASKVFKFAETGDEFKNYCERQSSLWKNFLVEKGYHGTILPALVEEQQCSNLSQYIGQFLFGQWKEHKDDLEILDKACETHIFPALKARCNYNLEILKENIKELSPERVSTLEHKIIDDLAIINSQYWAAGYIYSHTVFMNLAIIHHINVPGEEDASEVKIENDYLKSALECEIMAVKLFSHPTSQEIFNEHDLKDEIDNIVAHFDKDEQMLLEALHIDKVSDEYKKISADVEIQYNKFGIN